MSAQALTWPIVRPAETLRAEAVALVEHGNLGAAEELLRRALEHEPNGVECLREFGVVLAANDRWVEAGEYFRRAARLSPGDANLMGELGRALLKAGDNAAAVPILRAACELSPRDARLFYRLGLALWELGGKREAFDQLSRCIELDASFAPALRQLGEWRQETGHSHRALEPLRRYLQLCPGDLVAKALLANVHWSCGELENCLTLTRELIDTGSVPPAFHSTHLCVLWHRQGETAASLRAAAAEWGRVARADAPPSLRSFDDPNPERKLRVGYVTQEFAAGSGFHFILPFLRDRDASRFEVFVYHTNVASDKWTRRARPWADHWRALRSHADVAAAIAADRIDILVDLSNHYGSHLVLFQDRHAPIQLTFPDYPGTTGAANIDYVLTDHWVCPPGFEDQYTEEPLKLGSGYLPYAPPASPRIKPLPALRNGFVTFALLQRPAKLNGAVWDAVARVLQAVPGSTLLIHYHAEELDDSESPVRRHFAAELELRGVSASRLRFRGRASLADHLALFGEFDIALDTFPYNGQTTTCECLWMGVPVVTLRDEIHAGRVAYEILDRVGLGHLAAGSVDKYVSIAAALAADTAALAKLRRNLRSMVRRSPVVDGSVVKGIENAYRKVWRKWCLVQNTEK